MCANCYEKYLEHARRIMLFCLRKAGNGPELLKLCDCQRYCSEKDKYIPHKQKESCKYYE